MYVYCTSLVPPTFRAENSHTGRDVTWSKFEWMIEPEICFADLADDINLAEDYLKYCVRFALENCAEDLEFFENSPYGEEGLRDRLKNVLESPFKVRQAEVAMLCCNAMQCAFWGYGNRTMCCCFLEGLKKTSVSFCYDEGNAMGISLKLFRDEFALIIIQELPNKKMVLFPCT